MTSENEGFSILDYCRNRSIKVVLLAGITIMTVVLFATTFTDKYQISTYNRIRLDSASAMDTVKLKMEALPPIPIKIVLEQATPTPKNSTEDLKWDYNWDHKQWKNPADMQNVPSRTLYLIRHGQYNYTTGLLNERGKAQVQRTAERLRDLNRGFSTIIHSSLPRARETAEIIHQVLPNLPMVEDDMLAEGGPTPPKPTITYWGLPERDYHVDGPRLESAFRKYFYRADKSQRYQSFDILVGHANIFRYFVLRGLQLEPSAWMRLGTAHASITALTINPDSLVLLSLFGDCGHLPPDMVTY